MQKHMEFEITCRNTWNLKSHAETHGICPHSETHGI